MTNKRLISFEELMEKDRICAKCEFDIFDNKIPCSDNGNKEDCPVWKSLEKVNNGKEKG